MRETKKIKTFRFFSYLTTFSSVLHLPQYAVPPPNQKLFVNKTWNLNQMHNHFLHYYYHFFQFSKFLFHLFLLLIALQFGVLFVSLSQFLWDGQHVFVAAGFYSSRECQLLERAVVQETCQTLHKSDNILLLRSIIFYLELRKPRVSQVTLFYFNTYRLRMNFCKFTSDGKITKIRPKRQKNQKIYAHPK